MQHFTFHSCFVINRGVASAPPPFSSWRDGNRLKGHYFKVYHEQTNSDFFIIQNANGTQTYIERTPNEKFHYYNYNTQQWEPFTPAGYETSAQKIQRMKNIAAATGVFGEKYQKLLEFIFLSLATLAAGGPAGRALFNVVYQFLNQLITARIKGEPFSPDYFDLLIDTIPIKTTPAGEFYVELVKEIFKAFIDITSKEGVAILDKNNRVKGEILNIVVSTIISKYGMRLFGSGLGRTEHEVVDALLKTTTLISTIVTLGLYELE